MTERDCRTIALGPFSLTLAGHALALRRGPPSVGLAPRFGRREPPPVSPYGERRAPHAGISGSPCEARRRRRRAGEVIYPGLRRGPRERSERGARSAH